MITLIPDISPNNLNIQSPSSSSSSQPLSIPEAWLEGPSQAPPMQPEVYEGNSKHPSAFNLKAHILLGSSAGEEIEEATHRRRQTEKKSRDKMRAAVMNMNIFLMQNHVDVSRRGTADAINQLVAYARCLLHL